MADLQDVADAIEAQKQAYEYLKTTKKNVEDALDEEDKQELHAAREKAVELLDAAALDRSVGAAFDDETALHRAETEEVAAKLAIREAWQEIWAEPDHADLKKRLDEAQQAYNRAKANAAELIQEYVEGN